MPEHGRQLALGRVWPLNGMSDPGAIRIGMGKGALRD